MESTAFTPEKVNAIMNSLSLCGGYAAVALASLGSTIGTGLAGCAAVGAWKRCYVANKPAPFLLTVFAGAPLSQTIYAMVLMMIVRSKMDAANPQMVFHLMLGVLAGVAFMLSAVFQGKAGAAACDAYGETEKGFANFLMVLGIVETVALFVLVFAIMIL